MPSSKINPPLSPNPKTLVAPNALISKIATHFQSSHHHQHPDPIRVAALPSTVGPIILGGIASGLCFLEFFDPQRTESELHALARILARPIALGPSPLLNQASIQLAEYFEGRRRQFTIPLVFHGTPFQKAVWTELCRVPFGETRSYQQLAQSVGRPKAVRAVGQANGANRIAILAPCHRIINTGGKLGGYAGGLDRKQSLLQLECQSAPR